MAKSRFNKKTFTKKAVKWLLIIALLDLQLSYILAFLGREQIAETLSGDICNTVIATMVGYLAKSFFETREEEKLKAERGTEEWRNVG